jgi:hypothetical protein
MNTDRLNYSIKTIQPISELNTNSKALTFFQGGIASNMIFVNIGTKVSALVFQTKT